MIRVLDFSNQKVGTQDYDSIDKMVTKLDHSVACWISLPYLPDISELKKVFDSLRIEETFLKRVYTNSDLEDEEISSSFVFAHLPLRWHKGKKIDLLNVWFILGENVLLSIQDKSVNILSDLQNKLLLKSQEGVVISPEEVFFLIFKDTLIFNYRLAIRNTLRKLQEIEDQLFEKPGKSQMKAILEVRNGFKPYLEYFANLKLTLEDFSLTKPDFVSHSMHKKLRRALLPQSQELLHNYVKIIEWIRELVDIQRTNISESMNIVMQRLTIVSVIFLPITFIAGVFGMNFPNIPGMRAPWGYPVAMLSMLLISLSLFWYMKRNKWI